MNKIIKCKCGIEFNKFNINMCNITVRENSSTRRLEKVFEFRCEFCLQGYYQLLPDDIQIKND